MSDREKEFKHPAREATETILQRLEQRGHVLKTEDGKTGPVMHPQEMFGIIREAYNSPDDFDAYAMGKVREALEMAVEKLVMNGHKLDCRCVECVVRAIASKDIEALSAKLSSGEVVRKGGA